MTNKSFFLDRWAKEMKRTLLAVKALPQDMSKLEYRPEPLSRSAHEIIGHILPHAEDLRKAVDTGFIEEQQLTFQSTEEAYQYYETQSHLLLEKLESVDDDTWENAPFQLGVGGLKLYEGKMMDMFWVLLFDTIHHRGQLSTYYRAMGARNPSIYGPPAEDTESFLEAARQRHFQKISRASP